MQKIGLALTTLVLLFNRLHAISWSSVMEPYEKQHCFYVDIEDPKNYVTFYYSESVTKLSKGNGANLSPVKLQVFGPANEVLQDNEPKTVLETKLQPTVPGTYSFCLSVPQEAGGQMHRSSRRVFDVDIDEHSPDSRVPGGNVVQQQQQPQGEDKILADKLERTARKLKTDLEDIVHTTKYVKNREKRNLKTVEEANSRIWWFSILECVLVVGMSILQVAVLKQLFGTRSRPRV